MTVADRFLYWLFLFFLFNVMGWVLESVIESVCHKRPINRGFLLGPYIPIYGVGGILFAVVGRALKDETDSMIINAFLVFFIGMAVATMLEYIIGSILERVFKKKFWDYSTLKLTYKFTYKNRISLVSSLFWGICSLFMTYFLYGKMDNFVNGINTNVIIAVNFTMALTMFTDAVLQIRRQEHIHEILEKFTIEQLKEMALSSLMRIGSAQQVRDFRDAMIKNFQKNIQNIKTINENISENLQKNIQNIKNINENISENISENIQKIRTNFSKNAQPESGNCEAEIENVNE